MIDLKTVKTCQLCGEIDPEPNHYYSKHKIRAETYYQNHFPKKDLLTEEPIPFRELSQYFTQDFLNKTNLKNWLKDQTQKAAQEYCLDFLERRRLFKELIWTPTQVELRSLISPSIVYFNQIFKDGYLKACESMGYKTKFKLLNKQIADIDPLNIKNKTIITDSREQKPLKLNTKTKIEALPFGDYFFNGKWNIYIERKGLSDWLSTTSRDYDRFQREIERAAQENAFLVILVECSINDGLSFNYLPHIKKVTKVTPDFIWSRTRKLVQKYPNIQYLFANGRAEAVRLLNKIFFSDINLAEYDLQAALDMKMI